MCIRYFLTEYSTLLQIYMFNILENSTFNIKQYKPYKLYDYINKKQKHNKH